MQDWLLLAGHSFLVMLRALCSRAQSVKRLIVVQDGGRTSRPHKRARTGSSDQVTPTHDAADSDEDEWGSSGEEAEDAGVDPSIAEGNDSISPVGENADQ